jgi:hypothetical protein
MLHEVYRFGTQIQDLCGEVSWVEKLRRAIRQICQLFSLNPTLVRASSGQPLAEFLGGAMWAKSRRVRRNKETIIIEEPAIARLRFADARLAWL